MIRGLLILLLIAGCAPREILVPMPDGVTPAETVTVFTVTNRAARDGRPTPERGERLSFAKLDIAVPPNRAKGSIRTPLGRTPRPEIDFLLNRAEPLAGEAGYRRAIAAELQSRPPRAREVIIYVHGFNTTFSQGALRMAQLMHDLDLKSVARHTRGAFDGRLPDDGDAQANGHRATRKRRARCPRGRVHLAGHRCGRFPRPGTAHRTVAEDLRDIPVAP